MNDDEFLFGIQPGNTRWFPARLDSASTAKLLGFSEHDISILVADGLLRPLGKPAPNGPKHFALVDVKKLAMDRDWLNRATKAVSSRWAEKNFKQRIKKGRSAPEDCQQNCQQKVGED